MKRKHLILLVVLVIALAWGVPPTQATPARALLETDSATGVDAPDLKQAIDDFVAGAGGLVGAEEIVSFINSEAESAASLDLPFGAPAVFNPAATYFHIAAARLTDTKFVVVYTDIGNASRGTAIVGQVTGTDITYGAEYVFNAVSTSWESVAALSATKFVVAYRDGSDLWGKVIVGQVTGTTISYGVETIFNSASTLYASVAALSDTKFVVAYTDGGNSSYGTARVGQVAGTAISYGTETVFNSANTPYVSVAALSAAKFVVAYQDGDNSSYGTARVGDVTATTITYGAEAAFNPAGTECTSVAALTDAKFVVAYRDAGNSDYGTAIVGQVAGNAIAYGAEAVFNWNDTILYHSGGVARLSDTAFVVGYENESNSWGFVGFFTVAGSAITVRDRTVYNAHSASYDVTVVALSESQFVVAWDDESNSDYGTARVGTLPALGPATAFNPNATYDNIAAAGLTAAKFVVVYRDVGNSNYGTARVGQVAGTTITWGNEYVFNLADTQFVSVAALSATKFVVAYTDVVNSNYGTTIVGQVTGTTITWGNEYVFYTGNTEYASVAALTDAKFVVAFVAPQISYGLAIVGQVAGTTITYDVEGAFSFGAGVESIAVAALTDAKFVVAGSGGARVGQVAGTDITWGNIYAFGSLDKPTSVAALTDTKFVVVYQDRDDTWGKARVGQVAGTTITYGAEEAFNGADTNLYHSGGVARLSDATFVVGYENAGDDEGQVVVGAVSGNSITFGFTVPNNAGSDSYDVTVVALSPWTFVVAWEDQDNFGYGTAKVGTLPAFKVYLPLVLKD